MTGFETVSTNHPGIAIAPTAALQCGSATLTARCRGSAPRRSRAIRETVQSAWRGSDVASPRQPAAGTTCTNTGSA
jgi:hypothetical protein